MIFLLFFHPSRNNPPIKRNITLPIINIGLNFASGEIINATIKPIRQAHPSIKNIIAPTLSFFQDKINMTTKINDGILCINNPSNISQKLDAESNTSNENIARNNTNIIIIILGVQKRNLFLD